jgi:hypothetical protein
LSFRNPNFLTYFWDIDHMMITVILIDNWFCSQVIKLASCWHFKISYHQADIFLGFFLHSILRQKFLVQLRSFFFS